MKQKLQKILLLCLLTFAGTVAYAYDCQIDGIWYNLSISRTASVTYGFEGGYSGTVTIPEKITYEDITYDVTSIGESAFYNCHELIAVNIPNSITSIGNEAFGYCYSLTAITIGTGIHSISMGAFVGTPISSVTFHCNQIASSWFADNSNIKEVIVGDEVTLIMKAAFEGCTSLTTVSIGSGVTSIGPYVFRDCPSLISITSKNTVPPAVEGGFDSTIKENVTLYVPAGSVEAYKEAWGFVKVVAIDEDGGESGEDGEGGEETPAGIAIDEEHFPDEAFRDWLLAQEYGEDKLLTEDEIKGITEINVNNQGISDLKGIEHFTALTYLNCADNYQMTSLDVSKNTALVVLNCAYSRLESLDVTANTALIELRCNNNGEFPALDVSKNLALRVLDCGSNQLKDLDVSQNTALEELWCSGNQLPTLDVSKNTALTLLDCSGNNFTELDLSENPELNTLYCEFMQTLTSLDVSRNTKLRSIQCSGNGLTSLDFSKNTLLQSVQCSSNQLTSLNVSNTALWSLSCYANQISGEAMDAFISSLPEKTAAARATANEAAEVYVLRVYDSTAADEGNVCTKAQVETIKAKGWTPYYYNGSEWLEYTGYDDETTGIGWLGAGAGNVSVYNMAGQKVNLPANAKKGVYIVNGKKVVVK